MKARKVEIIINGKKTYTIERSIGNEVKSIEIFADGSLIFVMNEKEAQNAR